MIDRHIGIHLDKIALVRERERETCLPIMSITIMIAFHCERLLFSAVHVYYRFDIRWKYGNEKTRRTCIIIIKRTGGGGQQYKKRRDIHAMCPILLHSVSAVNQSEKNCDSIYYALDLFFYDQFQRSFELFIYVTFTSGNFFLYLLSSQIFFFFFSSLWKFQ